MIRLSKKEGKYVETSAATRKIYRANLQRVGSVIPETIALLKEYVCLNDWNKVKSLALTENILKKSSSHTVSCILQAVRYRLFSFYNPNLPRAELVAKALSKEISLVAKSQILLVYLCETDALVKQLLLHLVKPRIISSEHKLSAYDVYDFLMVEKKTHPELSRWSEYLLRRWSRGFLSVLRDHGFMEPAPSKNLTKPSIRVEAFTFFLLHLIEKKLPTKNIIENKIWDIFLLSPNEKNILMNESQKHGWIRFLRAGEIMELTSSYRSLEEWLNGLG